MTYDEQIEILQAAKAGKVIEEKIGGQLVRVIEPIQLNVAAGWHR